MNYRAASHKGNLATHPNSGAAASVEVVTLQESSDVQWAARVMADSDPWRTLGIGFELSEKILANPARERYLARVDGKAAGFLILNMAGGFTGYVQLLGVAPEYRGKGVGRALLEFAERRIFRTTPNVFICVSDFNSAARAFYAKLGYEPVGELKDYVVRGHAEILLRKSIAPLREFKP